MRGKRGGREMQERERGRGGGKGVFLFEDKRLRKE